MLPVRPPRSPSGKALVTWPPVLATAGPGSASRSHAHHAMHLVLARHGELGVTTAACPDGARAPGLLTAPDVEHALDGSGTEVVLVFFDPESPAGTALRQRLRGPYEAVSAEARDAAIASLGAWPPTPTSLMQWAEGAVTRLVFDEPRAPVPMHPRVAKVLRWLREAPPGDAVDVPSLAQRAGLSEGRFQHAFRASVGLPVRPYLLWLRTQRATIAMAEGQPLAAAAAHAGFADAAHMTRTFRKTFGILPSELQRVIRAGSTR